MPPISRCAGPLPLVNAELVALAKLTLATEIPELRLISRHLGTLFPLGDFSLSSLCGAVVVVSIVFHFGGPDSPWRSLALKGPPISVWAPGYFSFFASSCLWGLLVLGASLNLSSSPLGSLDVFLLADRL